MDTYKKILPLPFLCQSERICGSSFTMTTDEEKLWQVWGRQIHYLLFVLYTLVGQKTMTQKKICNSAGLTKQTVNNVIRSVP